MTVHFPKAGLFLILYGLLLIPVSLSQTTAPSSEAAPIITVPSCPLEGFSQSRGVRSTSELRVGYYPSNPNASIKNPTALTLRLAFNGGKSPDNDRTISFQKMNDGSWQAFVALRTAVVYAIWYVRDDTTGTRDDNHGKYWDLAFCGPNGKKRADAIRYQVRTYSGSALADDIKRSADYEHAISVIETSRPELGYELLDEEWFFKYRLRSQAEAVDPVLVAEINKGLVQHSSDPVYVRRTVGFLIRYQSAFPVALVEYAVQLADRVAPELRARADLERERAESVKDSRGQVNALGAWLSKYPNEPFYDDEVRKMRLKIFGELRDVKSAEECFQDLAKRYPKDTDLYVTMASIYVTQSVHLDRALALLDEAKNRLGAEPISSGGMLVTLVPDESMNKEILNLWLGRTLAAQQKWAEAEGLLVESASVMNDAEAYAVLANVEVQRQEWTKAKNSYLEAAKRESIDQQENVERFVAVSLKTGTLTRTAALQELTAAQRHSFEEENYKPKLIDMPLPNFAFSSQGGAKVTPSSLHGKIIVLNLWATWCQPCISELGGFDKFRQLHPDIVVLPVAQMSNLADIKKVFQAQGLGFDEIFTSDDLDAAKFGSNSIPQTYVIDSSGRIRIAHYGGLSNVVLHLEADLTALGVPLHKQ